MSGFNYVVRVQKNSLREGSFERLKHVTLRKLSQIYAQNIGFIHRFRLTNIFSVKL